MSEARFDHVVTLLDGDDMSLTGITDMIIAQTDQGSVLYTISRMNGGVIMSSPT